MSTKVQGNRSSSNEGRAGNDSPVRRNNKGRNRERSQERDAAPDIQGNQRSNRKNKELPLAGFWPQLQQQAFGMLSSVRTQLRTPLRLLKNNMYTAITIAVFSVLIGAGIMGYSAYRARQNQGFVPRMKGAFESARHSGEGYLDSAIHGIEGTAAPLKDALLHAKDKVAAATGLSPKKAEGVIDSAKHQMEDFASTAMKTAEGLSSNVKNIIDSTTGYFNKGSDDLTSSLKANAEHFAHNAYDAATHAAQATKDAALGAAHLASKKGEDLTSATKKKAEELTGLTQQKRDELAIKTKKTVDAQSVAAKHKIDEAAVAAKKRVDDLADAAKKAADKAAGHSTWHF
jgi:hypothetical protein